MFRVAPRRRHRRDDRPTVATLLEEKMQAVGLDVAAAADRLRALGAELGFAVREAHLRLCDRLGAVVLLYLSFDMSFGHVRTQHLPSSEKTHSDQR